MSKKSVLKNTEWFEKNANFNSLGKLSFSTKLKTEEITKMLKNYELCSQQNDLGTYKVYKELEETNKNIFDKEKKCFNVCESYNDNKEIKQCFKNCILTSIDSMNQMFNKLI